MGSYSVLTINNLYVGSIKNRINYNHLRLFAPSEIIEKVIEEDYEKRRVITARTSCAQAKRRLEIQGLSREKAIHYFNNGVEYQLGKYKEYLEEDLCYEEQYNYYKNLTFDVYCDCMKKIYSSNIDLYDDDGLNNFSDINDNIVSRLIISKLKNFCHVNHTCYDSVWEDEEEMIDQVLDIYISLLCVEENDSVELDLTDVIESGWVDKNRIDDFYENGIDKTVIITEGKTDIHVLSKSLKILYPDLNHLYTYFDFETYKADGGASYLVKLLKSLSAAKIKNRIVALFDNDAAAINELQQLDKITLLSSIKIVRLPELEFCRSYPTIGPSGLRNIDINGLAVGIEMFFGEDIIKCAGEYYPIIWNGYFQRIKKYQGVIEEKDKINKLMQRKLSEPDNVEHDWEPLKLLWEHIFSCT